MRLHRRFGAQLGLAALMLQLALSLGHIHIGHVHVEGLAHSAGVALADALGHSQRATLAQAPQKSPTHHSGQSSGDDNDYCAICASIFLASTSLAAQPPVLLLPSDFERFTPRFDAASGLSLSHPAFFQSRAPPRA